MFCAALFNSPAISATAFVVPISPRITIAMISAALSLEKPDAVIDLPDLMAARLIASRASSFEMPTAYILRVV